MDMEVSQSESEDSGRNLLVITLVPALAFGALLMAVGWWGYRHCHPEPVPDDLPGGERPGVFSSEDATQPADDKRGEIELKTITRTTSSNDTNLAETTSTEHETRILTPAETCRKADLFFPGFVEYCEKYEPPRYSQTHEGIRLALHHKLSNSLHELCSMTGKNEAEVAQVEQLMKHENAEALCITLGMAEGLVRLRFEVVRNLQKALDIPIGKTDILHSIEHLIDTIHVHNPFGEKSDMTGNIIDNYKEEKWLSYLGVNWKKNELIATVERVEDVIEHSDIKRGYYVNGTIGSYLDIIVKNGGKVDPSRSTDTMPHDFGDGVYCFQEQIRWALTFAIDRCWPVDYDELQGGPIIRSCNPAIVLFPKPMHSVIKNHCFEVGPKQKRMSDAMLRKLLLDDEKYNEFLNARKKWKNDRQHSYWKDFVKLSLCYQKLPHFSRIVYVVYGLMHDSREGKKPTGNRAPVPDPDGWIQHCFRESDALGKSRLFIEFNTDWNEWFSRASDSIDNEPPSDTNSAHTCAWTEVTSRKKKAKTPPRKSSNRYSTSTQRLLPMQPMLQPPNIARAQAKKDAKPADSEAMTSIKHTQEFSLGRRPLMSPTAMTPTMVVTTDANQLDLEESARCNLPS